MRHLTSRTWPYGTAKPGVVAYVASRGAAVAIVFIADGEPDTPYLLLYQDGLAGVEAGQRGTITFTEGGPTGAYWHYTRDQAEKGGGP